MSSDVAISCQGLGKAFQLYLQRNDQLMQALFGRWKQFYHPHWVLRDISFEVSRGECWGIIGRNGTGKTTLLQLICGISQPSYGNVAVIRPGRADPGARRRLRSRIDRARKRDDRRRHSRPAPGRCISRGSNSIAAFADIGEFFNQPLKMYSSGMTARLAFAVCAHADADILIVDEALSVGDATFAHKCDDFIRNFAENGHDPRRLA